MSEPMTPERPTDTSALVAELRDSAYSPTDMYWRTADLIVALETRVKALEEALRVFAYNPDNKGGDWLDSEWTDCVFCDNGEGKPHMDSCPALTARSLLAANAHGEVK